MLELNEILANFFDIVPTNVKGVKGGWSADAYRVETEGNAYFIKVYNKELQTIRPWIKRIDSYIQILAWLSETSELIGRIVKPVRAIDGGYKIENANHVFLLFEFIHGEVPGEQGLSQSQIIELADFFAKLHSFDANIPVDTTGLTEDISLSFCAKLENFLEKPEGPDTLKCLVCKQKEILYSAITEVIGLRDKVRLGARHLVLCHTDAHFNNVIQSDRLVIVDWEDLKLAPPEADLFMYANHPDWKLFIQTYTSIRQNFYLDVDMLRFYLIRRRLDDIWYYVSRGVFDKPNENELSRICDRLRSAFHHLGDKYEG